MPGACIAGAAGRWLSAFADFDENELPTVAKQCAALRADEDGMKAALTIIAEALPAKLKETAYALARKIAAVDHRFGREETRIMELPRERLGLDRLIAAALGRGCRARHATRPTAAPADGRRRRCPSFPW